MGLSLYWNRNCFDWNCILLLD